MACMDVIRMLALYLGLVNVAAFWLMGVDKQRAKRGEWRIPEKTLFFPVIIGGGLGGVLGMRCFRHKTKHPQFQYGFPAIAVIEFALLGWLLWRFILPH